jgi:KDO2-lipid IV(A) lauroyltransferase
MPLWGAIPFFAVPRVRRQIARNLARVVGPAPPAVDLVRAYRVLVSFARALATSYAAHGGRGVRLAPELLGENHLAAAAAAGRGVVLATGHLGLWQLGPYLLERTWKSGIILAMAPDPDPGAQGLEDALELRRRFQVVHTDRPYASFELLRALRGGGLVAVQLDRPPPGSGPRAFVERPFCGAPARFPVGPAALARAAGAPLIPVFLLAQGLRGVRVQIEPPIEVADDLEAAVAELAAVYERCVRAHPFQWYAFHDFWAAA